MICPNCGSSRTEYIKEQFQESFEKKNSEEKSYIAGFESHIKLSNEHTRGEGEQSGITIQRRERWACFDCGNSFREEDPVFISGHRIWIGEQFFSDYYRWTALVDLKLLFSELKKKLPRSLTYQLKKKESPTYPFEMDLGVRLNRGHYILTCYVALEEYVYVKLEGITRK